jgi:hypothetical protein
VIAQENTLNKISVKQNNKLNMWGGSDIKLNNTEKEKEIIGGGGEESKPLMIGEAPLP